MAVRRQRLDITQMNNAQWGSRLSQPRGHGQVEHVWQQARRNQILYVEYDGVGKLLNGEKTYTITFAKPSAAGQRFLVGDALQRVSFVRADTRRRCGRGHLHEPRRSSGTENGPITEGEDVKLARAIPEIDVIVGGHTHTFMRRPVIVNGTPIVQAGCYGRAVGELVIRMDGRDGRSPPTTCIR